MNYKVKGLAELVARNLNNETQQVLNFPENTYTAGIYSTNFKENDIRINYSSLARPDTVYSYDFNSNKLSTLKVQEIPSGFDPEEYATERVFVKTDGVEVPVSLFYKKSLFKGDGSNPLYLYGYGSYGLSIAPSFRSSAVSLVNRGFIYAIAHIRGGDDLGHDWYEDAKFLNKKRTFSDFIAVTEELINLNYTSKGNIVIVGGSAGGMLVGNVINQRPELFKAVIAHVPFVDVLNTMLDENLPLTPGEYKEWGNPKEKDYFEYMKSYSPYDNVSKQNYPSLFVSAGLSDPRVGYWEAAKWVARLRDRKLGDNVIINHYLKVMDQIHYIYMVMDLTA
jgi:oligopeptidase B